MADKKITDMTELAAGSQATGDLITVVDVSEAAAADKNKKMTMENLFKGIPGNVGIGTSSPSVKLDVRGGAIFNEDGASVDFRVESDSNQNMLVVDGSANRVGIATATPTAPLDVNGEVRITDSGNQVHSLANTGSVIFNEQGAPQDFRVESDSNTSMLFVDGSEDRVGIGTASPGAVLDVNGNTQITGNVFIRSGSFLHLANTGNTNNVRINADDATSDYVITLPPTAPTTDGHVLSVASGGGTADVELEWAAGAGSISPLSADLDVGGFDIISTSNGNIDLSANGTGLIRVTENSLSQVPIVTQHDIGTAANQIPLNQYLGTAAFQDSSNFSVGNLNVSSELLIGTTSATGGTSAGEFVIEFNGASQNCIKTRETTGANPSFHHVFVSSSSLVGSITTSSSATFFNTSSDYRLKENIVTLDGAIDRVKQLAPKRFNFKIDADTTVDGFLAHEAQTVVPEAVTGTKDQVDADNEPVYQGIDQAKLVPLLTAALQEAIAKIETLETKVAALEG